MANGRTARPLPARYLTLIRRFPLRPIRSEAELDRAQAVIDELLDHGRLDPAEQDYLDVLGDLVEHYEDAQHAIAIDDLSDADMLEHLIEAKGVTQAEVARSTGIAESRISEVLSARRRLTREQVEQLAIYFHVPPGVFLKKTEARNRRSKRKRRDEASRLH